MQLRRFLSTAGASLCLATLPAWGQAPAPVEPAPVQPAAPAVEAAPAPAITNHSPSGIPPWLVGGGLATGAFIALTWLHLYQQQRHWKRVELARQEAKNFRERQAVKNVLDILDYEEYRTFYVTHPQDGRLLTFEANDHRLQRALRSHDQMVKTRHGLDEIKELATETDTIDSKTLDIIQQYDDEEFVIEIILRDWFDSFLGGLDYFDILIEAGLVSAEEIKPFIIYWIRLIGDRQYRRKGGSGFYDQLFHYIHWSGYHGVKSLFERYGFKIIPPPYSTHDFTEIEKESKYDTYRAICLAKAAYLVYEDREYVNDIIRLWQSEDIDNLWKKMSNREYVVEVIKNWLREGEEKNARDIRQNFTYLNMLTTDTQAFLFRDGHNVILVFRGSQQLADWKTNLKIRLKEFTILADQEAVPPKGRVHRGFSDAWQSVEKMVVYYLKKWWTPDTKLWVTGHSLGGALAAMATVSLEAQGFRVSGLYTFGQPRIADWQLVNYMNGKMRDRMVRFANNNDVVPLIPPQIIPWVPTRVYGHMGEFRYFTFRGFLRRRSWLGQRFPDRLLGFITAVWKSGPDAIDDHKMEFYLANLEKALAKEAEEARLEIEQKMLAGDFVEDMKQRLMGKKGGTPEN
jgi:predicted lipase